MKNLPVLAIFVLVGLLCAVGIRENTLARAADTTPREQAQKQMNNGNWKDAYEGFSKLALDPKVDPLQVGENLVNAIQCLNNLGRQNEVDSFREKVIAAHAGNWRLLQTAAHSYLYGEHQGYIVAGKFNRGYSRGGDGKYVNSYERDRVRALQLMVQAMEKSKGEKDHGSLGSFYSEFSQMLMGNRGWEEAWRLQYLTDLTTLPDYEEGYYYYYYNGERRGAPVDEEGNPVYYSTPASWNASKNDGERWRWLQEKAIEESPSLSGSIQFQFAQFLQNQFDVQTMAQYGRYFQQRDDGKKNESGPYDVQTLGEDETIAKLATGIKRFKLPEKYNFIKIYQKLTEDTKLGMADSALQALAQTFENRRQYDKAADYWQRDIKQFGEGHNHWKRDRLEQIVKNWGQFEPISSQPANQGAKVDFRFRNGKKVHFKAQSIDIDKLLADCKDFIKSHPKQLDSDKMNISDIGYRLVTKDQWKYLKKRVAEWDLALSPRPGHFDKRITVSTPLQEPGAYLLTATMEDGNVSKIVLWVADTAIVKKQLDKQAWYFVGDAVNGKPIAKANVEFFGYDQKWIEDNKEGHGGGHYDVSTKDFAEYTNADGQIILLPDEQPSGYSWVIIARKGDRLAYLGFTGVWFSNYYDHQYNETKTFVITDRPVYRPEQTVKFKFWVNNAKYDQEGKSAYAGKQFNVRVENPKGEKVFEKTLTADEYGGFDGELTLDKEPTLGVYSIHLNNHPYGGGSFRVEEYKKPEFEVKVDAPEKPIMLGEKVTATISAKYYFGAPVTEAKVKYKILRSSYTAGWYPSGRWDWFYGSGYWWFACDYDWYPGWSKWGCYRPVPFWWRGSREQPEVVVDGEAPISKDGTLKVDIDTALAKAIQGDRDHRYEITAEVTDLSRRTIVGTGTVLVAREPFKVYAWVNRGHYRVGDAIHSYFSAQTLDNKPVKGTGVLRLLKIGYKKVDGQLKPNEAEVQRWEINTNDVGRAYQQIKVSQAGQYRLSYKLTDSEKHTIEGGYVFVIRGEGFDGSQFRFNDIELTTDKQEYRPGEKVNLMINTNRPGSTVMLFIRPANGIYLEPKILHLDGKSTIVEIPVTKKDMPNFFVEAVTLSGGKVFSETREIVVPPEKRVLNVEVTPSSEKYKPGEKATMKVKVTDINGKPYSGSVVVSLYDKSVEYISGGSNVPNIKEFFWKWRRSHYPRSESSLDKWERNLTLPNAAAMGYLGAFGYSLADEDEGGLNEWSSLRVRSQMGPAGASGAVHFALKSAESPMVAYDGAVGAKADSLVVSEADAYGRADGNAPGQPNVQPTVRSNFADTALWVGSLKTDENGEATVDVTMPDSLTTWKARVWAMGDGTAVGEGSVEVVTSKDLLVRLQAPRFFTQKDEVVISANVHNYLKTKKKVTMELQLEGGCLELIPEGDKLSPKPGHPVKLNTGAMYNPPVEVDANSEKRIDWRVKVLQPGEATIRVKALTDEESDAMEMKFPVYIHGMLKMDSYSGVIRPDKQSASVRMRVPNERLPEQSRLEVRYSPTLAGAMVDALPYMVDYPYGCTEQTLNRFLPTVITQKILLNMGLDLKDIQAKRTNLNAQEIGDDKQRAEDWKRTGHPWSGEQNPVFDQAEVQKMVKAGLERLGSMQCADGGWGWFSGWGEQSYPHTTALVVHGLQIARVNDVALVPGMLERGVQWLKNYQDQELAELKLWDETHERGKSQADALDAFVYMVLVDEKMDNKEMREHLYRDRNYLPVYAKSMFGIALHRVKDTERRDMLIKNIEQYLVQDDENQTAYLQLPENNWWWCWFGSEYEAQSYFLKLLTVTDPHGEKASRLVKYLINNRKHATYWNSTRDTAIVIEAFADYMKASGEDMPDLTVNVLLDGKQVKEVKIDKSNLFSFDNKFVLEGLAVTAGEHTVELRKKGSGSLYFNAYLTIFTLEDMITKAGLEIKVNRKYYKLVPVNKTIKAEGSHGQAVDQKVEKYERQELANLSTLKSGDLVEIELEIDSKNDYEYILFEDMKAAGFEPVEVRSGYNNNDMRAYMELRDERVCFFVRSLARGKHSVSYRMRAEIPGLFSALPTKASAMYAPELKANSDELKLRIED